MKPETFKVLCVVLFAVLFATAAAQAVRASDETPQGVDPLVNKSLQYSFSNETSGVTGPNLGSPLGSASGSRAPWMGVTIGSTYIDQQHVGRMTRMVDWGNDVSNGEGFMIHFAWTRLAPEFSEYQHYAYNVYYAGGGSAGTFLGENPIQGTGEYAGYVSLDVTEDGRAVLSGHNNQGSGSQTHTYWDFGPGFAFFGMNGWVPDGVIAIATGQNPADSLKSCIWPSIRYQETPGKTDPVLHVFTQVQEPNQGDPQAIIYFRKVGDNESGGWDDPAFVVDTVFDIAQDVACSNTDGKVALTWIANLPDHGDCDTCSSQTGQNFAQWDNDVYYQISYDYGANWEPRVNLTQNVDGEEGYRPYTDLQALVTDDNELHIVWGARYWPADANSGGDAGLLRGRIFHWSENVGFGDMRTVADLNWDQTMCNGGAWQLNGSKMNIGECDGKLYVLWTQFNDVPNGIEDDCAERAFEGDPYGSANGELYLSVSDDGGLTWDAGRNLTNTRTPGCDSADGMGGECMNEHWSSMSRHGTNLTGDMSGAEIVDPTGAYAGEYFLDVQYIGDPDPGSVLQNEGTWRQANVQWFRLPCIEPVFDPRLSLSWFDNGAPTVTFDGVEVDSPLVIENTGNADLTYSVTLEEDNGPSGWLYYEGFSGYLASGASNVEYGMVTLNKNGIVDISGGPVELTGRLIFDSNAPSSPDTVAFNLLVLDTATTNGLHFAQVDFVFKYDSLINSNWGWLDVDVQECLNAYGMSSGFLNVYTDQGWVVDNLWLDYYEDSIDVMSTYFQHYQSDTLVLSAHVELTTELVEIYSDGSRDYYLVASESQKFGGVWQEMVAAEIGDPPLPILMDSAAPTFKVRKLPKRPNKECADNQCMPMAIANSLQYLEDRFGLRVPHVHKLGLGKTKKKPSDLSLVGQIDTEAARVITNRADGNPHAVRDCINGKFSYLKKWGLRRKLIQKHQGQDASGNMALPAGNYTKHRCTSTDETVGGHVTFNWIVEQIDAGSDVEIVFSFAEGAHCVRVMGYRYKEVANIRKSRMLYLLHDKVQTGAKVNGKWTNDDRGLVSTQATKVIGDGPLKLGVGTVTFASSEAADTDMDGVPNYRDNAPAAYNPKQEDKNGDGIGDVNQTGMMQQSPVGPTDLLSAGDSYIHGPVENIHPPDPDHKDLWFVGQATNPSATDTARVVVFFEWVEGDGSHVVAVLQDTTWIRPDTSAEIFGSLELDNCPDSVAVHIQTLDGPAIDIYGTFYHICYEAGGSTCCQIRGDINDSGGAVDISDLVYLVDYMFTGGPPPPCLEQADVNGDGAIDISDLVYLVDYMFTGGLAPAPCP